MAITYFSRRCYKARFPRKPRRAHITMSLLGRHKNMHSSAPTTMIGHCACPRPGPPARWCRTTPGAAARLRRTLSWIAAPLRWSRASVLLLSLLLVPWESRWGPWNLPAPMMQLVSLEQRPTCGHLGPLVPWGWDYGHSEGHMVPCRAALRRFNIPTSF